jgi:ABC-2 type transport system ATP-binding protein
MVTNGFGGSYNDSSTLGMAENAATDGFVALSSSGLGFGGSGCQIELDSPTWDGKAASELISWLGTLPAVASDGPDDPRIGMVGGSYGGGIQFSTASDSAHDVGHPRIG